MLSTSCSKDDEEVNDSSVVGTWKLTGYDIGFSADINNDGTKDFNILNEIDCVVNEELVFKTNGTVISKDSFHHIIDISKSDPSGAYVFNVECSEGYISFATSYIQTNNMVEFNDVVSIISNGQFTRVFENAVEIYNEDFTEIVDIKNLTLTYTKQ
jgi:hypothetical protein